MLWHVNGMFYLESYKSFQCPFYQQNPSVLSQVDLKCFVNQDSTLGQEVPLLNDRQGETWPALHMVLSALQALYTTTSSADQAVSLSNGVLIVLKLFRRSVSQSDRQAGVHLGK